MRSRPVRLNLACAAVLAGLAGCASGPGETRDAAMYAAWAAAHREDVRAFEAFLAQAGVAGVVRSDELLRSASSWRDCGAEPYATPPPAQWPAAVRVLELLRTLVEAGVLGPFEVHSAYRAEPLNTCAGGARGSAHLRSFAVDLTPRDGRDATAALCAFWRGQGRAWAMGLSRYPSGRIHVDTAGYRTWGADQTGRTTACAVVSPVPPPPG